MRRSLTVLEMVVVPLFVIAIAIVSLIMMAGIGIAYLIVMGLASGFRRPLQNWIGKP